MAKIDLLLIITESLSVGGLLVDEHVVRRKITLADETFITNPIGGKLTTHTCERIIAATEEGAEDTLRE